MNFKIFIMKMFKYILYFMIYHSFLKNWHIYIYIKFLKSYFQILKHYYLYHIVI